MKEGEILQGKYRVERVLGKGGMGIVVAAHHLQLDEKVAIKAMLPHGLAHPEAVQRFEREARAAVKIKSEHVARVLDVGRFDDGTPYLVMEHLDGNDLSNWLAERGPLPGEQAVELVVQACEAIAEAHTLGIVHRDLKPANIFVIRGRDGLPAAKVLDFGISKSPETGGGLTGTRAMLGSPEYMSPEQFGAPKTVDWRTDIWSLGVTLFELLGGRVPFPGDTLIEIAWKIAQAPVEPSALAARAVPAGLQAVILRCLAKDRTARYQDVAELAAALAPFGPGRTHALVERISRIVHGGRAAPFAATSFAPPASPAVAPRTQGVTSWPSDHPSAPRAAPTVARQGPRAVVLGASAAGVVLLTVAMCAALWRRPASTARAVPQPSAPSSAVASVAPSASAEAAPPPEPIAAAPPLSAAAPSAPTFRGTRAVTRANWSFAGVTYHGVIHTNGATGYADVSAVQPGRGPVVVREDLRLQQGPKGWSYVGSNPRYADDGSPVDYYPNVFLLDHGSGAWTFVETCAIGTGMCTRMHQER